MSLYKCIPVEHGVDISINSKYFFTFKPLTHLCTDLGDGKVRISRKIDNLIELYDPLVTDFTDVNGNPVGTDFATLNAYFTANRGDVKAGEGVSVNGNTVSVVAGGPATLGGFKVGTGLQVDGEGRLSASASSEVTKVLPDEAAMLALAAEPLRPYRVIRLDTNRLYFLNAGDSPSVLSNWFVGPSIDQVVLSFNSRTGAVVPEFGDYTTDLVGMTDKTLSSTHKFVLNNGKLYIENVSTNERVPVVDGADLSSLSIQFNQLNDIVTNASTGLQAKVASLENTTSSLNNTINNPTTGVVAKVDAIDAKVNTLSSKDSELEDLILFVNKKADSTAANTVVLDTRLSQAETDITTQRNRLSSKADIVNGKVPLYQLPDFPVGRKVKVANKAARLALPVHPDITIAYELDTGDAWGLNANANPSAEANWDKLGNAQATGVLSFNGRTGNIAPQSDDYITEQIAETPDKFFVTPTLKSEWDGKETTSGAAAKADAAAVKGASDAKVYADANFIPKSQKGIPNGIAPLGSAGKVPAANLLTNVAGGVPLLDSNAKVLLAQLPVNVPNGIAPLGSAGKVPAANLLTNVAGGVTLLDSNGKVPISQLPVLEAGEVPKSWMVYSVGGQRSANTTYTNDTGAELMVYVRSTSLATAEGVTVFINEGKSGAANIVSTAPGTTINFTEILVPVPAGATYKVGGRSIAAWSEYRRSASGLVPASKQSRIWRNVNSSRAKGVWYVNDSGNEREVHIYTTRNNDAGYLTIEMQENESSGILRFSGNTTQDFTALNTRCFVNVTVPTGWRYSLNSSDAGGRVITNWQELS